MSEEKNILQKHNQLAQQAKEKEELFWANEYNNYSYEQKVQYWLANIHHGMRVQGEATGDDYSEFSLEWYKNVKSKEPDFDLIFKKVVSSLGFDFNWKEYEKRISI